MTALPAGGHAHARKHGSWVERATNGREALIALDAGALLGGPEDCQMPEMDGYEATAEIRRRERSGHVHTAIIAMTANTMQGDRERCLAAGMDDYLSKPLRPQALKDALERWAAQPGATISEASPTAGA
jgi:CheY-like chemotaxis protein